MIIWLNITNHFIYRIKQKTPFKHESHCGNVENFSDFKQIFLF